MRGYILWKFHCIQMLFCGNSEGPDQTEQIYIALHSIIWYCLFCASFSEPWENPDSQFQNEELGDGFENASDLSDRDIDTIARKVGLEWERMATFLDYGEGQKGSLKTIYKDKV